MLKIEIRIEVDYFFFVDGIKIFVMVFILLFVEKYEKDKGIIIYILLCYIILE